MNQDSLNVMGQFLLNLTMTKKLSLIGKRSILSILFFVHAVTYIEKPLMKHINFLIKQENSCELVACPLSC